MVHISELNTESVEKVTDIVKKWDEIIVKCFGYDKRERLNFSRKEANSCFFCKNDILITNIGE